MNTPLADRIRPATLDDVVGQQHILGEGKALRNIMESGRIPNLIFYGPSGVGKGTIVKELLKRTRSIRSLYFVPTREKILLIILRSSFSPFILTGVPPWRDIGGLGGMGGCLPFG